MAAALFGQDLGTVAAFAVVVSILLSLDLYAHRKTDAPVSLSNAASWSAVYILAALGFSYFLYRTAGPTDASLFLSGFVMEKVLSVDNLVVFIAVFAYWGIPDNLQHRVLHFGILGAIVFRLIFVAVGGEFFILFAPFTGAAFGVFVMWSAIKLWTTFPSAEAEAVNYRRKWYTLYLHGLVPILDDLKGDKFFWRSSRGVLFATPLFFCLVSIEASDVAFSFDSVPVVIAITQKPVLIYSAMIFAILGLRSLYFILSALLRYLVHLTKAVVLVLLFVGAKLLATSLYLILPMFGMHSPGYLVISPALSLAIVGTVLAVGVAASFIFPEDTTKTAP